MARLTIKQAGALRKAINSQYIQRLTTEQCRDTEVAAAEMFKQYPGNRYDNPSLGIQEYREVIVGLMLDNDI